MTWSEAEAAIRTQIETQWALSSYSNLPLAWENENSAYSDRYMAVLIEGIFADKTIYGSAGKRMSIEGGIVFFHAFVPTGEGKTEARGAVEAMTGILELQTISDTIKLEGGNPPSPVEADVSIVRAQPGGNYYRCSGSVPFILIRNV